ncbi:MAG: carboxymuconolactone decarboxylase family protein [Kangiellaceae bacterium]|nr:carboxymuconolactone decarboxylase family protein [Kangiellaceae bacterium]
MKNQSQSINYPSYIGDVFNELSGVHDVIDSHGLNRTIYHLILLRASQINNCRYCIEMHTREALEDGEAKERLTALSHWRQSSQFTEKEQAAFNWCETLTSLAEDTDYSKHRAMLRRVFSDKEISVLTANIAMINLWNRIQISEH